MKNMEKRAKVMKSHSFLKKTASKVVSWLLIMAMLVTLPVLPNGTVDAKAAGSEMNITIHFDNSNFNYTTPAMQYWGGTTTAVTGATATDQAITGWGGAVGQLFTQDSETNFWSLTLKGDFTGFQFLDYTNPSSNTAGAGFVSSMSQYTGDTPTDLYYVYKDGTYGWYLDAAGTTPMPIPEYTNLTIHYQNADSWTTPAVQYWQPSNITVSGQVSESAITGWGGVLGHVMTSDTANSGFYTISLKGTIDGMQFLDMADPNNNTGGTIYDSELTKFTEDTPTDVYYLYKDGVWGWYMDQAGTITLASTKEVSESVTDNKDGSTTFTTIAADVTDKVQLVYGEKSKVEADGESAMTTVAMKADVNNAYNSSPIYFGDGALDIVYYYLVDGVKKTISDGVTVGTDTYLEYTRAAFTGRTVCVAGTFPGKSWDATSNAMTYVGNGLYTYTFSKVPAASYQYKIAMGAWDENYGASGKANGDNIAVTVTTTQDVTVYYSDFSHYSRTSVDYVYGASVSMTGTGIAEGTTLSDDRLTGIYSTTIAMTAGTYSDTTITYDGNSYVFDSYDVDSSKNVNFYFDPETEIYYNDASSVVVDSTKLKYDTQDTNYKSVYGAVATDESITFSIDTGVDATAVKLYVKGKENKKIEMTKDGEAVSGVQKWTTTTSFSTLGEYDYFFAIYAGASVMLYGDDDGYYGTGTACDLLNLMPYDLVVYQSGFETPDWMKDAVVYQIFPERFYDGDTSNNTAQTTARGAEDYEYVTDWYSYPENPEQETLNPDTYPAEAYSGDGNWSNEIYGGDLDGIIDRMDYLKALGVNVIYLNPVFSSISSHRYDTSDYTEIDPILGTEGDFDDLVQAAEDNDMHIILDGVFNHVSDDSKYFDRYYKYLDKLKTSTDETKAIGAYPYWAYVFDLMNEEELSQTDAEAAAKSYFETNYGINDWTYTKWFDFDGNTSYELDDNDEQVTDTIGQRAGKGVYSYDCWWGYDSMPVIVATDGSEYQTEGWAQEIIGTNESSTESDGSVTQYWLSEGSNGWRLDVANEVSDETWQHFRKSVKALSSDNVIVGEIWTDAAQYLMGDMYDSVMNYVFRGAVLSYTTGGSATDYIKTLERLRERYPEEAFYAMMNLVSSHDTTRILSYLYGITDDRNQKETDKAFPTYESTSDLAKARQYLVAFLQFTYAGAPTIYYGDEIGMVGADDPDDRRAMTWGEGNKELVEWYAKLANIRNDYTALRTGDVSVFDTGDTSIVSYLRSDSDNKMLVLANNAETAKTVTVNLADLGVTDTEFTDLISGDTVSRSGDTITVSVPALSGAILTATSGAKTVTVDSEALKPAYDSSYIVADAKVTVSETALSLTKGATKTITATGRDTITWTSNNTSVATVVNGKIVAVGAGTAKITATQTDGLKAACDVTVTNPVTGLSLNKSSVTIAKGKTYTLKATVTPADAQSSAVTWKSSKTSVATVDKNGKVTAKGVGSTVITVSTANGKTATCKVTVNIPSTKVVISSKEYIKVGTTKTLSATILPSDSTDKVTWTSSDKKVVTVDSKGKIKGIKAGSAKITATTTSGKKITCKVTVVKKSTAATSVKLNKKSMNLNVGKTYDLNETMSPSKSTDSRTWSSSNKKIATVDQNGIVTAVKKGTVTIKVKTSGGKVATCKVTVKVPATSVKLNKSSITVKKGATYTLKATAAPSNTTDTITWKTSNKKIATVDKNGKIKGIKKGSVTITATTTSGKKTTCKVTVK